MTAQQYELVELLTGNYLETADIHPRNEIKTVILENLSKSKESWLVNTIVDMFMVSNSNRCLDVLICINDPHDKHLFDRLNDHLKGSQKMGALTILAHLVRREPIWLHKIVSVQLLPTMLKTLKVETDGLILVTGALILTGLLPIVPVSIYPFIMDIYEVFNALASLCLNKSGNVPEIYMLHLQVGMHCMFHRLYSMYPWHFITYLKAVYSRPENFAVFVSVIQPMLNLVKMHPLLVTGDKDKEFSRDRWKEKEVHDIIVECAQLSLDPFDREFSEGRVFSSWIDRCRQRLLRPDGNQEFSWDSLTSSALKASLPVLRSEASDDAAGAIWSPSKRCGLSTPPPDSVEVSEKASQTLLQNPVLPVNSFGSLAVHQTLAEGTILEPEVAVKSDECLTDLKSQSQSMVPPLVIEPPTPPDNIRGADSNAATPKFFQPNLSPDGSVSSDDSTASMIGSRLSEGNSCLIMSSSLPSGPSPAETNTAEMAALVRKIKRIRQDSINITRDVKATQPLSRSCPHLASPFLFQHLPEGDQVIVSQDSLDGARERSGSGKWMASSGAMKSFDLTASRMSPAAVSMVSEESQTGFFIFAHGLDSVTDHETEAIEKISDYTGEEIFPCEFLLGLVLPFAPFIQCFCCMRHHWDGHVLGLQQATMQTPAQSERHFSAKVKINDCITPLHMNCSPAYLLDQHIVRSCELHWKVADEKTALLSPQTKCGASGSSANDLSMLRSHIHLMHNLLLFERHRQELHAKRNRRLLGRTVKVVSLEEQNTAMRDQLRLQESEMARLRSDLQTFRKKNHDMEETILVKNQEISNLHRRYLEDKESLEQKAKQLEETLINEKNSNEQLVQLLERTNNKLFSREKDLELLRQKVDSLSHLERQVIQLNTELLLMGELHQKYQQRLSEMNFSHNFPPQLQMCLDSCKAECQSLQLQLQEKALAFDEANNQLAAVKSQLKLQENNNTELKNQLEASQTLHIEHIRKLEERHKFEMKSQQSLQFRILELQSEIEMLKNQSLGKATMKSHSVPVVTSATDVGGETSSVCGSLPVDHWSPLRDHSSSQSQDSPANSTQK